MIIVYKQTVAETGSVIFVMYAVYNTFVVIFYSLKCKYYGAEVNLIDHKIKDQLMILSKECNEIKELCEDSLISGSIDCDT